MESFQEQLVGYTCHQDCSLCGGTEHLVAGQWKTCALSPHRSLALTP